jgi:hypothetical protein
MTLGSGWDGIKSSRKPFGKGAAAIVLAPFVMWLFIHPIIGMIIAYLIWGVVIACAIVGVLLLVEKAIGRRQTIKLLITCMLIRVTKRMQIVQKKLLG